MITTTVTGLWWYLMCDGNATGSFWMYRIVLSIRFAEQPEITKERENIYNKFATIRRGVHLQLDE